MIHGTISPCMLADVSREGAHLEPLAFRGKAAVKRTRSAQLVAGPAGHRFTRSMAAPGAGSAGAVLTDDAPLLDSFFARRAGHSTPRRDDDRGDPSDAAQHDDQWLCAVCDSSDSVLRQDRWVCVSCGSMGFIDPRRAHQRLSRHGTWHFVPNLSQEPVLSESTSEVPSDYPAEESDGKDYLKNMTYGFSRGRHPSWRRRDRVPHKPDEDSDYPTRYHGQERRQGLHADPPQGHPSERHQQPGTSHTGYPREDAPPRWQPAMTRRGYPDYPGGSGTPSEAPESESAATPDPCIYRSGRVLWPATTPKTRWSALSTC